jgi:hypothetical protein
VAVNIRKGTRVNAPGGQEYEEGEEGAPNEAYYGTGGSKASFSQFPYGVGPVRLAPAAITDSGEQGQVAKTSKQHLLTP